LFFAAHLPFPYGFNVVFAERIFYIPFVMIHLLTLLPAQ